MAEQRTDFILSAQDRASAAFRKVTDEMGRMEAASGKLGAVLTRFGGALSLGALAAGGAAAISSISGIVKGLAELDDASERTGSSVEKLSALANVAAVSGVSLEQLEAPMIKLAKALGETDEKATAAKSALESIGLDPQKLRTQDTSDALLEIAKRLDEYKDGLGKTAFAQAVFGKSGAQNLPLLKDLAQATGDLGKVTAEQAAAAEQFEKNIKAISVSSEAAKRELVAGILPALVDISAAMREAARDGGLLKAALVGLGGLTANILGLTDAQKNASRLIEIEKELGTARAQLQAGSLKPPGASTSFFGFLIPDVKLGEQQLGRIRDTVSKLEAEKQRLQSATTPTAAAQKPAVPFREGPEKKPGGGGATDNRFENAIKQLEQEALKQQDLTRFEEVRQAAQLGHYGKLTVAEQARLEQLAAGVDIAREDAKVQKEVQAAVEASAKAEQERIRIEGERITAIAEKALDSIDNTRAWRREVEGMVEAYNKGLLTVEQLNKASQNPRLRDILEPRETDRDVLNKALKEGDISLQQYTDALKKLQPEIEKTSDIARDLGLTFSSAFEDAFVNGKKLSDVLKGLEQDLLRIGTRKLVTEPLAEKFTALVKGEGSGPSMGGILDTVFEKAGSIFSGISGFFGGFRAGGGPVSAGSAYLVGERGPELFIPGTSGMVAASGGAGGASINVSISNNFPANTDRRTIDQAATATGEAVQRALSRNT